LLALLQPRPRELLPHSRGLVEFAARRALHGRIRIVAVVPAARGSTRSFTVAL
jgi:hypothetical protein